MNNRQGSIATLDHHQGVPSLAHIHPPHTVSGSAPGRESDNFDPGLLWVTFRRCWSWAVPLGAVLAVIAAYFVFAQFVPTYRATHLLQVNQDHVVFQGVLPTGVLARTERQWITNPVVLEPVLDNPSVREAVTLRNPENAEHNLKKNLSVTDGGTKTMLLISYTDPNRIAAAKVCNAIVDSYLKHRSKIDNRRMQDLVEWIDPSIEHWQSEVRLRQDDVRNLSRENFGYAPDERVGALENSLKTLSSLRSKIASLKVESEWHRAEMQMQEDRDASWQEALKPIPTEPPDVVYEPEMPSEEKIAELVAQDGDVRKHQRLISMREEQIRQHEDRGLARVSRDYYEELFEKKKQHREDLKNATEVARKKAIEELQRQAERNFYAKVSEDHQRSIERRESAIAKRTQERISREHRLEEMQTELRILEEEYNAEKERLEKSGGKHADLAFAKEDLAVASEVLMKLKMRVAALETEGRRGDRLQSVAPAQAPSRPVEQAPWKKIFVFSGGAFMLPFLLGLVWEMRTQRVTDSSKMQNRLALPLMGEVSRLPAGTSSGRSQRVFEESIDSLRANLFLSRETSNARSIAIASSMSGEGKSSVASQLAVSIAKATGETVLLIDADLRSPDQHDIFGLQMGPGLCKVLAGEIELDEAIDKSLGELVHVLPAGRLNESPHRLLNVSAMRDLVDNALDSYGYVVVDTAPILAAGESLAVASSVDVTLLCVLRDVSRMENVARTTRRLEAAGATLAGTVFSGVPARQYAYRYGDYRYVTADAVS